MQFNPSLISSFGYYNQSIPSTSAVAQNKDLSGERKFKILSNIANACSLPIIGVIVGLVRLIMNSVALHFTSHLINNNSSQITSLKNNKDRAEEQIKKWEDSSSFHTKARSLLISQICRGAIEVATLGFAGVVLVPTDLIVSALRYHNKVN